MMTCEQYEEILQNFLDGKFSRLPEPVQTHLETCVRCRQFLEEMQALQTSLAGLSAQKLTPAGQRWLQERIQARLQRLEGSPGTGFSWRATWRSFREARWPRWAPAVATLAAVVWLLMQTLLQSPVPEPMAGPNELDLIIEEHTRVVEATPLHPVPYGVTLIALGEAK